MAPLPEVAAAAAVVAREPRLSPEVLPLLVLELPRVRPRQLVVVAVDEVVARLAPVGAAAELLRGLPRPVFLRPLLRRRVEAVVAAEVAMHQTPRRLNGPSLIRARRWQGLIASIKWSRKRM